ncbi:MAG: radical SAM family heme chaperone HemW [Gemmatimonadota bacterium]
MTKPRSLYIHVPFCVRRCSYCDFAVEAIREPPVAEWLDCVLAELDLTARDRDWHDALELDTLYVGGGTPSLLGTGAMASLLERTRPRARLGPGAEWTCEANPESFGRELAADWRAAGVNRLSLGVQTFDAGALRWMGRLHGPGGPARAVSAARTAGLDNVSIDLIFGLPSRLKRDWRADLERAIALEPEHVSLYGLTAESGAPLGRWVSEGRETLADEDRYADEYLLAHERLTAAGFEAYEVSNFALPGKRSKHNFVYWTGAPYAALGPGAHAYFPPLRRWNLGSWSAYRDALAAGRLPTDDQEVVDSDATDLERIWLGLRTADGLSLDGLVRAQAEMVRSWTATGFAAARDGMVRLTPSGWLLLDRMAMELHEVGGGRLPTPQIDAEAALVQIAGNSKGSGR